MTSTRQITIPACRDHHGVLAISAVVDWRCIHCGAPRGEPIKYLSYDGSLRLAVDTWTNPCGHVELYSDVRKSLGVTP